MSNQSEFEIVEIDLPTNGNQNENQGGNESSEKELVMTAKPKRGRKPLTAEQKEARLENLRKAREERKRRLEQTKRATNRSLQVREHTRRQMMEERAEKMMRGKHARSSRYADEDDYSDVSEEEYDYAPQRREAKRRPPVMSPYPLDEEYESEEERPRKKKTSGRPRKPREPTAKELKLLEMENKISELTNKLAKISRKPKTVPAQVVSGGSLAPLPSAPEKPKVGKDSKKVLEKSINEIMMGL